MYHKADPKTIQTLFGNIAKHYDRTNAILSFGLHKKWNTTLVNALSSPSTRQLLDLCSGTGEIAFTFLKNNAYASAVLLDFCQEMLLVAEKKGAFFKNRFSLITADAQSLPLPDHSVDAVSIAYGIRNVHSPEQCFQEVFRVLRPNGKFGILELTRPNNKLMQLGHSLYLKTLLPLLGKWTAKDPHAYQYLSNSIQSFVSPPTLIQNLSSCGFSSIQLQPLMNGVATLILASKQIRL